VAGEIEGIKRLAYPFIRHSMERGVDEAARHDLPNLSLAALFKP